MFQCLNLSRVVEVLPRNRGRKMGLPPSPPLVSLFSSVDVVVFGVWGLRFTVGVEVVGA